MEKKFLERMVEKDLVEHHIESYNKFVNGKIQKIINDIGEIQPDLPGGEELIIKLGKVEIGRASCRERV